MAGKVAALILGLLFFLASPTYAGIYKWVDAHGRIHYSDSPIGDAAPVDDTLPPASIFTLPPEAIQPATNSPEPIPSATAPPLPSVSVPPTEENFPDDESGADQDPTVSDNQPILPVTPEDMPEDESAGDPADTAEMPGASLTPEVAPEDQFGPGSEFDNQPMGEENSQ